MKRVEQCALENEGAYLYDIAKFTKEIFEGANALYLGWLRFALDHVK